MGTELMNPEGFKKGPAAAFVQHPIEDSLADGIGSSYGVIRYKGKVWSVVHRGQRKNVVRTDDGTPAAFLDVVILSSASMKSKSYYKKYDPSTSDGERPICSSINGLTPDLDAVSKQSETCALCPRNVWKTMENGKKGRDCTDYKRTAVLLLPNTTKALFGEPVMEPFFLRVPPASLNALAQMGEQMDAQGYPYFSYITRVTFDPNESHPKMVFTALQALTDTEAPHILKLRNDPQTGRIVNGDVALPTLTAPVTETTPSNTPSASSPPTGSQQGTLTSAAPAQVQSPATPTAPLTGSAGLSDAQPAIVVPASPTPSAQPAPVEPAHVDTGFGGVHVASQNGSASAPSPSSPSVFQPKVEDTGLPAEADADLDARIAGLLKT